MPHKRKEAVRDRFDFKLDPLLAKELRARAKAEQRKITAIIERALRLYFDTKGPAE